MLFQRGLIPGISFTATNIFNVCSTLPRLFYTAEKSHEAVVILLRNGISLMVVTSRTPHCHPQHPLSGNSEVIIQIIKQVQEPIRRFIIPLHEAMISCRDHGLRCRLFELITCQLFQKKLIIGGIRVQRIDHIVTVTPDMWFVRVPLKTVRLSVSNNIKPVPRPLFPIVRRGQKPVDDLFPRLGRRIFFEGLHLLKSGRQPRDVETCPPDQLPSRRWAIRLEPVGL